MKALAGAGREFCTFLAMTFCGDRLGDVAIATVGPRRSTDSCLWRGRRSPAMGLMIAVIALLAGSEPLNRNHQESGNLHDPGETAFSRSTCCGRTLRFRNC